MEKKLQEERCTKQKVENRLLEAEKQCSMLDCDIKQAQQQIEELFNRKENLTEEVSVTTECCLKIIQIIQYVHACRNNTKLFLFITWCELNTLF